MVVFYETSYPITQYVGDVDHTYTCNEWHELDPADGQVTVHTDIDGCGGDLQDFDSLDPYDIDRYARRYPEAFAAFVLNSECQAARATKAIRDQLSPFTP